MNYFTCTESDAGPIIDFVWGGLNLLSAVVVASDGAYSEYYDGGDVTVAGGLIWAAFSTSAGVVGLNKSK